MKALRPCIFLAVVSVLTLFFISPGCHVGPTKPPRRYGSSGVREESPDVPPLRPTFETGLTPSATLDPAAILQILERVTLCELCTQTTFRIPTYSGHGDIKFAAGFLFGLYSWHLASGLTATYLFTAVFCVALQGSAAR